MPSRVPALLRATLMCAGLGCPAPAHALAAPPEAILVRAPGQQTPYLLGAWQAGRWVPASAALARQLPGGPYRRQPLVGPADMVRGGPAASLGDPCVQTYEVPVTPQGAAHTFEVYTTSARPHQPRPVTVLPTSNATYREIVRQDLVRRGLRRPVVQLTAVIRTDLDGNGTQEVIIEASRFRDGSGNVPPPTGQPGDYSVLLLRHVAGGRAVTTVLGAYVAPPTPYDPASTRPMPLASLYRVAGVADLNGDGRLELLTYGAYYEGDAFAAHEWTPAGGLRTRLDTGCGV